jgi:uncharacterized protein (TIGR02246 family)
MKEAHLARTVTATAFGLVSGILLLVITAQPQTELGTAADREAILAFRQAHNVAWDSHNAKALANLYAPDGDRISASGVHYIGRDQIEHSYLNAFKGTYKTSSVKDDAPNLRFLTSDVALVDVDDELTTITLGARVHHHVASIYVKREGKWEMVAERATAKQ